MGVKVDLVKVDRVVVALGVRRTLQKSPQRLRPLTTRRGGHLEVLAHLPVLVIQLVPLLLLDAGCNRLSQHMAILVDAPGGPTCP